MLGFNLNEYLPGDSDKLWLRAVVSPWIVKGKTSVDTDGEKPWDSLDENKILWLSTGGILKFDLFSAKV